MDLREWAGSALGAALSPAATAIAFFRRARIFHPTGWTWRGTVTPVAEDGDAGRAAKRLAGGAIIRYSTGLEKELGSKPDIFGCAIRFCEPGTPTENPGEGDQDLMTATFTSVDRFEEGKRATDLEDLLANDFYAIAPFRDDDLGPIKLRLTARGAGGEGKGAIERLARAAEAGKAVLTLEVMKKGESDWIQIVDIAIDGPADLDQRRLRFHPFRNGRGIHPTGWLNAARRAVYPASAFGRGS